MGRASEVFPLWRPMTHSETERHDEASPMCGRSTLTAPPEVLAQAFCVPVLPLRVPRPRYNVAPTQSVS
jgi:hypothetical protein